MHGQPGTWHQHIRQRQCLLMSPPCVATSLHGGMRELQHASHSCMHCCASSAEMTGVLQLPHAAAEGYGHTGW